MKILNYISYVELRFGPIVDKNKNEVTLNTVYKKIFLYFAIILNIKLSVY